MSNLPFITIINPVRNIDRTIEKNLEYLIELDYPKDKMEIVFADGGSKDRTVEIIKNWQKKFPFIKLVEVANCKSPGQARNAALKVAQGDYILFTDGDCAPRKNWVHKMLEPFLKDPTVGMVGGEILTLRTDPHNDVEGYCEVTKFLSVSGRCRVTQEGYYPVLKKNLPHEVNGNIDSPFFATANAAVSKAAADKIGREFWHELTSEDVDFSLRILQNGFKLYFKPDAIVEHMHRVTLADFCRQLFGYGFGHPLTVQKHCKNIVEICIQYFGYVYIPVPFFFKGVVYIGNFHFMHLFGIMFLTQLALGLVAGAQSPLLAVWGVLFLVFLVAYFLPVLSLKPRSKFFVYSKIRFLSNWALMRGGFKGMRTWGVLYIESSW
ncbi:MAG TPA: glycosyltransferase [Patescibacteria group bacterium]|nr:glycosyltransferase [Patescibacteria group bacterium]